MVRLIRYFGGRGGGVNPRPQSKYYFLQKKMQNVLKRKNILDLLICISKNDKKNKKNYESLQKNRFLSDPGTAEKRIVKSDGRTDRLTDWRTDMKDWRTYQRGVQYSSEYVLRCKKGTLEIWNRGEILNNLAMFKYLYINSNCVFSKTIWRKNAVAQWRRVGLNLR